MSRHKLSAAAWLLAVACVYVYLLSQSVPQDSIATSDTAMALLAEAAPNDFQQALEPGQLVFPRDHGPHSAFRTEWWYFTGHLHNPAGREFGFQLTLFRFEIDNQHHDSSSAWRTPRVLLGHFALSDFEADQFHAFERISRAVPALAGVSADPVEIWLDDWRIQQHDNRWQISAAQQGIELELTLQPQVSVVKQGERGLSRKSGSAGNASYYYSVPRLAARGSLRLNEQQQAVSGTAWLDREWSTSALDRSQQGWDWFSLQLSDGSTLMFYRLRQRDGSSDPFSAGSFVDHNGRHSTLTADELAIAVEAWWLSPKTGIRWPAAWRLELPRFALQLEVKPRIAAQEWRHRFRYWEGAVAVAGQRAGERLSGQGYVELTGYTVP